MWRILYRFVKTNIHTQRHTEAHTHTHFLSCPFLASSLSLLRSVPTMNLHFGHNLWTGYIPMCEIVSVWIYTWLVSHSWSNLNVTCLRWSLNVIPSPPSPIHLRHILPFIRHSVCFQVSTQHNDLWILRGLLDGYSTWVAPGPYGSI